MYLGPRFHCILLHGDLCSRYVVVGNQKCTEWLQQDGKHLTVKGALCTPSTYLRGPNCGLIRSTDSCFWDTRLSKNGNVHNDLRMTLNTVTSTLYTVSTYPRGPYFSIFWSASLYNQPFSRYKVVEISEYLKCTELPWNDFEYLTDKSILYIVRRPKFCPFRSTTKGFWDTRLSEIGKIGNAPNDLRLTLNT